MFSDFGDSNYIASYFTLKSNSMYGSGGGQTEDQGNCAVEPAENHKGLLKVKNVPKKIKFGDFIEKKTLLMFCQIQCVRI